MISLQLSRRMCVALLWVAALSLAGCTARMTAPVEERTAQPGRPHAGSGNAVLVEAAPAQTPAAREGYYLVKKGDTLYAIALESGQDWRDIASWNTLDNPNLIRIGQELRIAPPGGVVTRPVQLPTATAQVDMTRANPSEPTASSLPDQVKREPMGGVEPYSEEALARLKQAEARHGDAPSTPAPTSAASVGVPGGSKPEAIASHQEEGIDWAWPGHGKLLSRFAEGSNKGIDLSGKIGDPVLAAAAGRVVFVGESMRGYGKLVVIKHGSAFLSAYAHNNEILVKERDTVQRGQRIAELGDSDTEPKAPKLHFEIRRQGKPVDPLKYLPAR